MSDYLLLCYILLSLFHQGYTNSCFTGIQFVVSSNCTDDEIVMDNTVTTGTLSSDDVIANNTSCEVTAFVFTPCGNSSNTTISKLSLYLQ